MNCDQARQQWHDAFDAGAADAGNDAQLGEHLANCLSCRRYAEQMSVVTAAFDRLRDETDDLVFHGAQDSTRGASVSTVIPHDGRRVRLIRLLKPPVWGIAAAVVFASLLGVAAVWRSMEQPAAGPDTVVMLSPVEPSPGAPPIQNVGIEVDATAVEPTGITLHGKSAGKMLATAVPSVDPSVQMYWIVPVVGGNHVAGDS